MTPIFTDDYEGIDIYRGFKASAFKYATGYSLLIDVAVAFKSAQHCSDRIRQIIANDRMNPEVRERQIRDEFINKRVMTTYGGRTGYVVDDVLEESPKNIKVLFKKTYDDEGIQVNLV